MAFADIYKTGQHKRNLGHFANIVKLAMSDRIITENEQKVINRLKKQLHITDADYSKVIASPDSFPINPPANINLRLERFYNLISMVVADNAIQKEEIKLLEKISVGLGFSHDQIDRIIKKAVNFVVEGHDLDEFTKQLKKII
ncbi:tellurite resistance TerB family protein [Flavicella marina]|uniref:TerB family tellurite resistance protein n=1 Tax=Flavicella marina TaxID=1475951 RepID=UPI00126477D8|nr:TerB family tellurite resistance protein [Flavicella marina]